MPNKTRKGKNFLHGKFKKFSRKSQVEDWLPLMAIIIFLVFIFLILSLLNLNRTTTINEILKMDTIIRDSGQYLINYPNSQISLNNKNITVAEAISYYAATNDENSLILLKFWADEIFSHSSLETDSSSWSLEIVTPATKQVITESEKARTRYIARNEISSAILPMPDKENAEVRLFFVQTKFVEK